MHCMRTSLLQYMTWDQLFITHIMGGCVTHVVHPSARTMNLSTWQIMQHHIFARGTVSQLLMHGIIH